MSDEDDEASEGDEVHGLVERGFRTPLNEARIAAKLGDGELGADRQWGVGGAQRIGLFDV